MCMPDPLRAAADWSTPTIIESATFPVGSPTVSVRVKRSDSSDLASSGSLQSEPRPPAIAEVDRLLDDGVALLRAGELEAARERFFEVLRRDPSNKAGLYDLGVVYGL